MDGPIQAPFNDAQIAMLTEAQDDRRGGGIHAGDGLSDETYICVVAKDVRWLAAELQRARARRCGNCAHWGVLNWCYGPRQGRATVDAFCSDFTPKPDATT
jgi:hypothetical protein